jgi:hypothetical protein
MHIPPTPLPTASALPLKVAAPTRVLAAEQATETAVVPVASHTPALQVILGPIRAEVASPPVYAKPVVYQTYLRDQTTYQAGTASAQIANTLSSHLSSVRKNDVAFTPGLSVRPAP